MTMRNRAIIEPMRDLKTLREVGEAMNREEIEAPLDLTIEQSVKIFASLYEAVKHQLAETEELFRPIREAELIEFQALLRRLDEWRLQDGADSQIAKADRACSEQA